MVRCSSVGCPLYKQRSPRSTLAASHLAHSFVEKISCYSLFSSPEGKAYSIPVELSSVCVSVNIFKLEYLRKQWANHNEILSEPSLGWGKDCIRFWARSDRNSGVHGNG